MDPNAVGSNVNTAAKIKSLLQQVSLIVPGMLETVLGTISNVLQIVEETPFITYSAGLGVTVTASKAGVVASFASNTTTITIPAGVVLYSCYMQVADNAGRNVGADADGAVNWYLIKIAGTVGYNTSVNNIKIPVVTVVNFEPSGPSITNPLIIDAYGNTDVGAVAVGSNSVTMRISGMNTPNGGQMIFTNI